MDKSISELRTICQQKGWQESEFFQLQRKPSIYLTWLLLHTPVSANQVTVVGILLGLLGAVFLAFNIPLLLVLGLVFLYLGFILDFVDGEIARYRITIEGKAKGSGGMYLDCLADHLATPFTYFFLGVGIFRDLGSVWAIILGFLSSFGASRFPFSSKEHVLIAKLRGNPQSLQLPAIQRLLRDVLTDEPSDRGHESVGTVPARSGALVPLVRRWVVAIVSMFKNWFLLRIAVVLLLDLILPRPVIGHLTLNYRLILLMFHVPLKLLVEVRAIWRWFRAMDSVPLEQRGHSNEL